MINCCNALDKVKTLLRKTWLWCNNLLLSKTLIRNNYDVISKMLY